MSILELSAVLAGHRDRIWCCAFAFARGGKGSGRRLATCGGDKSVRIWTTRKGKEGEEWFCSMVLEEGHKRTIRQASFSPDGKMLCAASFDGTTSVWKLLQQQQQEQGKGKGKGKGKDEFECVATLEGHENEVKSAVFDYTGTLLATCGRDKSVWIWSVDGDGEWECMSMLQGHGGDVKSVHWHPTRQLLFSCSYDDTIKIWSEDGDDWFCSSTLTGHTSTVWSLSFDEEGDYFVSCSSDKSLKFWKLRERKNMNKELQYDCIATVADKHSRVPYSVKWSPIMDFIATGAEDDCIRIFKVDRNSGGIAGNFSVSLIHEEKNAHDSDVNCVDWCLYEPDHHSQDDEDQDEHYQQQQQQQQQQQRRRREQQQQLILASAGDDMVVKIWKFSPPQ